MSRIITPVATPEPSAEGLGLAVARLIEPEAWDAFDKRAERKGWGPGERHMELCEAIGRGQRIGSSVDRAIAIMGLIAGEEPTLELTPDMEAGGLANLGPGYARCPICLKANPCDRHAASQQRRFVGDPEYLASVRPDLDDDQRRTLEWLGQADSSALGECKGLALDRLNNLGLVTIGAPDARGDDYRRVTVTDQGHSWLKDAPL